MRVLLRTLLLTVSAVAVTGEVAAQPPAGSQLPPEENNCATCHGEEALWEGETLRLYIPQESLADDVHWQKGVNCHDCHGGDPSSLEPGVAHATDVDQDEGGVTTFRADLGGVKKLCGNCHQEQLNELRMGDAHNTAGERDEQGRGTLLECGKCHGVLEDGKLSDKVHGMRSVRDQQSPVFLDHQIETCGGCHEEYLKTYKNSVHGLGLSESGLLWTAACADCHGAHGVYYKEDERNPLHRTKVAAACGKCHRFIEERIQKSVHGRGEGPGKPAERTAPGGIMKEHPTCTSCHKEHALADPKSAAFRLDLPHRCGNCHQELSGLYAMSMHGQLTEIGYGPAAKCSDCHGAHDILPIGDPNSRLTGDNRLETCRECHPSAVPNFADFDPHADHEDPNRNPGLHKVYLGMEILLYSVFGFFGLHAAAWFVRSLIHTLMHGRPKRLVARQRAYIRFEPIHRVLHVIVIVSFLGLALTGLPLKYDEQVWAEKLATALGGFDSTRVWHRVCAVATFFYFSAHLLWMAKKVWELRTQGVRWRTILFGPDSPVPNLRDVQDFLRMVRWFIGLGPKPVFERWTYWEKFDYWAVFWGVAIIGTSGSMLWFRDAFLRILPGEALNVAKIIHSEEALLATGFIFAVHFFNTHFRPEKFPMDLCILVGLTGEEELREERPEFLARLRQKRSQKTRSTRLEKERLEYLERMHEEGKLDLLGGTAPSRSGIWLTMLAGFLALLIGLSLLVGMLVAGLGG